MRFHIRWPSGTTESCYSPSLVIKDYFEPGRSYPIDEFVAKSRTALRIASERVRARYGFPCSLAEGQLKRIESAAAKESASPDAAVAVLGFEE